MRVDLDANGSGALARVGLRLSFRADPYVRERAIEPQSFAGPTAPGETVKIVIPARAIGPVFTGVAVAEDSQPLSGAVLDAEITHFDAAGRPNSASTGTRIEPGGSFRLDWSRSGLGGSDVECFLRVERIDGFVGEANLRAKVPAEGELDLKTVRFGAPPLIASGQVVDDDSHPVEDATIALGTRAPPISFSVNHLPSTTTDPEGRFALLGVIPPGPLFLRAVRVGYLAAQPVEVEAGERDVTITLHIGGALAGSVVLPDGFDRRFLRARITLAADPETSETQTIDSSGRFGFEPIKPGLSDFELLFGNDSDRRATILAVHQVAIRPAALCEDLRLQSIDVASLVRRIELTVQLPDGAPVARGRVAWFIERADGTYGWNELSAPIDAGRACVPYLDDPVDLRISVPGFPIRIVPGASGAMNVKLRAGLPVRLLLRRDPAKSGTFEPVWVRVVLPDERVAANAIVASTAIEDGAAALVAPLAGRYLARVYFKPPPEFADWTASMSPDDEALPRREFEFHVEELDHAQVIDIAVDH